MSTLDPGRVDQALRAVIADLDYDLHKSIECGEETGEDTYHELVADFVAAYGTSSKQHTVNQNYKVIKDPDTGRWLVVLEIASYTGKRGAQYHVAALTEVAQEDDDK